MRQQERKIHEADWYDYETEVKALCGRRVKVKNCVEQYIVSKKRPTCLDCLRIREKYNWEERQEYNARHQNHANPSYTFKDRRIC